MTATAETHRERVRRTVEHVRQRLSATDPGHDWLHVERVWRTARQLAEREGARGDVVDLAALLHDVADAKFHGGDDAAGARETAAWLRELGVEEELLERTVEVVRAIHFPGPSVGVEEERRRSPSLEHAVVQDADRLDAIGAIGVARAFSFGGARGRPFYDAQSVPDLTMDRERYKASSGPTLDHFDEKLLLLKERMLTASGRELARSRHAFLERFVRQFRSELGGCRAAGGNR